MDPVRTDLADDGTAFVTVCGEIDFANCDDLAQAIFSAVDEWKPRQLRVDLQDATFIDSTGLGALIEGYQAATETGCAFVVVNARPGFRRVLDVTGLTELFGLESVTPAEGADAGKAEVG